MEQLLVHVFADYVTQSDWMAMNKNKKSFPCLIHVLWYTFCFLLLTTSWKALLVIGGTHFIIDRFPVIIRRAIWYKNYIQSPTTYPPFEYCSTTGYFDDSPYHAVPPAALVKKFGAPRHFFVTAWLYIITDNLAHLTINYFALKYLT